MTWFRVERSAVQRAGEDVLGRTLTTITNTTEVYTDTMHGGLRLVVSQGRMGPITLILDHAKYQRNNVVRGLANALAGELLLLPSDSLNLHLPAPHLIEDVPHDAPTVPADNLEIWLSLDFQERDGSHCRWLEVETNGG